MLRGLLKMAMMMCIITAVSFQSRHLYAHVEGFSLLDGASSVRIPVSVQNNVVLISLRINGTIDMNFILDTGVRTTLLTEPVIASFLAIDSLEPIKVRGLGGGNELEAFLAKDIRIEMPGVKGKGINMLVLPDGVISYSGMFGKPVYGIIGYELFRQFVVKINYVQEYIELHDPFKFKPPRHRKWETLPINIQQSKPYMQATLMDAYGHQVTRSWLLDTGASMGVALFNDDLPIPAPSVDAFLGQGLSGDVHGQISRNPTFSFGSFTFEEVITAYPDSASLVHMSPYLTWYGNIGSDVLSRFHVIFDYIHEKVYFRPNNEFKKPFVYNMSGLEFISAGPGYDQYFVSYVRPNSPAAAAGIKVDDLVISMNGRPSDELNLDQLYASLSKGSGRKIWIKVKRGSEVIKTTFKLEEEI